MKTTEYILEIYEPGSAELIVERSGQKGRFESESPFGAIQRGDLISFPTQGPKTVFRVVAVEHWFFHSRQSGNPVHKISIYTEEIDNTKDLRTPKGSEERSSSGAGLAPVEVFPRK